MAPDPADVAAARRGALATRETQEVIERLRAERDFCRGRWTGLLTDLLYEHGLPMDRARYSAEGVVAAAMRQFRQAAIGEGGRHE